MGNKVEEIRQRLGRGLIEAADMYSLLDEIDRLNAEATPPPAAPSAPAPDVASGG